MQNKRGLSNVIVTLIIIVISLIAVGLVWVVVQNLIEGETEEISFGFVTVDLEITDINVKVNDTEVKVKRKIGEGEISGLKFIVSDGINTVVIDKKNVNLSQLEERTFILTSEELGNIGFIKEISVAPVFKLESGKEKIGNVVDSLEFANKKVIQNLGAVSWWKLDGNAQDEIAGNHGVLSGNVSFVDGKFGKALKDGSDGRVDLPLSNELISIFKTGDFSFYLWWTPEKENTWWDVVSFNHEYGAMRFEHANDNNTHSGYWWGTNNVGGGYNIASRSLSIPYGERHNFVGVYDRTNNELRMYVDGENDNTVSVILDDWSTISKLRFFQNNVEDDILDEVIIFNKALSDNEVKALYELDLN